MFFNLSELRFVCTLLEPQMLSYEGVELKMLLNRCAKSFISKKDSKKSIKHELDSLDSISSKRLRN